MDKDINRIKVVLAEKKRTNKWLADRDGGCNPDVLVLRCNDDKIVDSSSIISWKTLRG